MIRCTFMLNGYGLSTLSVPGVGFFPAYSGNAGEHRNNPSSVAVKEVGPLPPGRYFIVDRPVGSWRNRAKNLLLSETSGSDRKLWFALYREDEQLDDLTFIDKVERGNFRLHPAGNSGNSNGCITLPNHNHYEILRSSLLQTAKTKVSACLTAYGTVQVY